MGLDALELMMETEERFGIQLRDKDFNGIENIGQFHNLVSQLYHEMHQENTSAKQEAFEELREALVSGFKFHKKEITPETPTEKVFPETNRKQQWKAISEIMKLKFPKLALPKRQQSIVSGLSICFWVAITALLIGIIFMPILPFLFWKCLLVFWVLLFLIALIVLSNNSAITKEIPNFCHMLGDLAGYLIAKNPDRFKPHTKQDIWEILKYIVAEQCGLEVAQITPETRFIEDLGF